MNGRKIATIVLSTLGGAATGYALGLLFAPRPGQETRNDLNSWLKDKQETGEQLVSKIRRSLPEKREQVSAIFRQNFQETI